MAKDAIVSFQNKINQLDAQIRRVLDATSKRTADRIKSKFLGGSRTTNTRLRGRTGELERSVVIVQSTTKGGVTSSQVRIEAPYAKVHFGKKGQSTVIRPKSARALTIPTKFAEDGNGVRLGDPDSPRFKNTFIANGKIFGQVGSGEFVPLFTLASQVRVPVRIDIQNNIVRPIIKPLEAGLARMLRIF